MLFSVVLQDGSISYRQMSELLWSLRLEQVFVIGEYTNANGPWLDDYFLVFVAADKRLFEVSYYAEGLPAFLSDLKLALGGQLQTALANSTHWNTRILWPFSAAGRPLFELAQVQPRGFWQRLRHRFGYPTTEAVLSRVTAAFIP